jgi:hypothetical protein
VIRFDRWVSEITKVAANASPQTAADARNATSKDAKARRWPGQGWDKHGDGNQRAPAERNRPHRH